MLATILTRCSILLRSHIAFRQGGGSTMKQALLGVLLLYLIGLCSSIKLLEVSIPPKALMGEEVRASLGSSPSIIRGKTKFYR